MDNAKVINSYGATAATPPLLADSYNEMGGSHLERDVMDDG